MLSRVVALATAVLFGCSRSASKSPESATSTATTSSVASASPSPAGDGQAPATNEGGAGQAQVTTEAGAGRAPAPAACTRTGKWALCSVEKRLGQSGFVVRRVSGEAPRRAGFSVLPAVYTLGRSRLEVFIYPTAAAVASDVVRIDTLTAAPRGAPNPWPFFSPTFVRSANLAAVFLTDNPTQAERLTLALTAGAPQP